MMCSKNDSILIYGRFFLLALKTFFFVCAAIKWTAFRMHRQCLQMLCQRNLLNFFSIRVSQNEFLTISAKNLQTMIINRGWYESGSRWLINQWSCRWALFIQPFRLGLGLFRDLRIRSMNINELSNSHRLPARVIHRRPSARFKSRSVISMCESRNRTAA